MKILITLMTVLFTTPSFANDTFLYCKMEHAFEKFAVQPLLSSTCQTGTFSAQNEAFRYEITVCGDVYYQIEGRVTVSVQSQNGSWIPMANYSSHDRCYFEEEFKPIGNGGCGGGHGSGHGGRGGGCGQNHGGGH